jgi:hypothetical protein
LPPFGDNAPHYTTPNITSKSLASVKYHLCHSLLVVNIQKFTRCDASGLPNENYSKRRYVILLYLSFILMVLDSWNHFSGMRQNSKHSKCQNLLRHHKHFGTLCIFFYDSTIFYYSWGIISALQIVVEKMLRRT